MAKITYRIPGQAGYADLPLNNIIYVLRGTTVTFKLAGPEFGGVQAVQPVGRVAAARAVFGGPPVPQAPVLTRQPSQIPLDVAVTFNTASATETDFKDTTVTCGTVTMTARAIVYALTISATPLDNFTGRPSPVVDLGVDERVDMGFTIAPATLTADRVGGLKWTNQGTSGGPHFGTLSRSAVDITPPRAEGTAHYIAPYRTTSAGFEFPSGSLAPSAGSLRKTVTLQLVVDSGPSKGQRVDKVFTVHTPQAEMLDKRNQYEHTQGTPSAGFKGDIHLRPRNCSFRTLVWREAGGTAVCTGYFLPFHGMAHHPTGTAPAIGGDHINTEVRAIDNGNLTDGCWVKQVDTVTSGSNPIYPGLYPPANKYAGQATDVASRLSWKIYWQYRRPDGGTADWITFQHAEHLATMDPGGRVTITKAVATKSFNLNDATVNFP